MIKLLWKLSILLISLMLILQACKSNNDVLDVEQFDYSWNLIRRQIDASRPELNANAIIDVPFIDKDVDPVRAGFNAEIDAIINDEITQTFKYLTTPLDLDYPGSMTVAYQVATLPTWSLNEIQSFSYNSPDTLSGRDVVLFTGHHIMSIVFTGSIYFGGIHPSSWHRSINYDFTTGTRLGLGDLFRPFTPYLKTIANYCINDLSANEQDLFPEYANDGAAAKEENYTDWVITPKGLLIIYEEYQVAPYVSGPQYLLVPYDKLSEIIDPHGPLGLFAK